MRFLNRRPPILPPRQLLKFYEILNLRRITLEASLENDHAAGMAALGRVYSGGHAF